MYAIWTASIASKIATPVANVASARSISSTDLAAEVSKLENSLKPLEGSFDRVENLLLGFTILVVVGLVVEYWDDIREFRHGLWERRTGLTRVSHADPLWRSARAVIGGVLVTIGVAGELLEEFNAAHVEIKLRDVNGRIDALLELEASTAARQAAIAARSAADLGVKVDKLPDFVAQKEAEITDDIASFQQYAKTVQAETGAATMRLHDDIAALDKARTDAQTAARQAETELAAMQAANAPRWMTAAQQNEFVARMKPFAGLVVNVWTLPTSSPDAAPLADLLGKLLKAAGWKVGSAMMLGGGYAKGFVICAGDTPKGNVAAAALSIVKTLRADGIAGGIDPKQAPDLKANSSGPLLPNPDLAIVIGSKL